MAGSQDHGSTTLPIDPACCLADLRALAKLSSDHRGAQRVAWTKPWDDARAWLIDQLSSIGDVEVWRDGADNLWAELPGRGGRPVVAIGSHLDSVPDGGRLDGCLGVIAGLESLRAAARSGWDQATLRLVDWADEEGRFGYSLLGSSAATGRLDDADVGALRDRDQVTLGEVFDERGLAIESLARTGSRLDEIDALLELHIEQGPVLEARGAALGVPTGSVAIHRTAIAFEGQAAHAGTTPLDDRHDAGLAAARLAIAARDAAREWDGLSTAGAIEIEPGVATIVPARATLTLDLRHRDDGQLAELLDRVLHEADAVARQEKVVAHARTIWSFPAVSFDRTLVEIVRRAASTQGAAPLVSGALHDAVAVAHSGLPAAMLFVRSAGGVSHDRREHSTNADLTAAVQALGRAIELVAEDGRQR